MKKGSYYRETRVHDMSRRSFFAQLWVLEAGTCDVLATSALQARLDPPRRR